MCFIAYLSPCPSARPPPCLQESALVKALQDTIPAAAAAVAAGAGAAHVTAEAAAPGRRWGFSWAGRFRGSTVSAPAATTAGHSAEGIVAAAAAPAHVAGAVPLASAAPLQSPRPALAPAPMDLRGSAMSADEVRAAVASMGSAPSATASAAAAAPGIASSHSSHTLETPVEMSSRNLFERVGEAMDNVASAVDRWWSKP